MKVKLLIAVNIGGRQYPAGIEADLKPKEAQALIRGRFAIAVKEKAIPKVVVEHRAAQVEPVGFQPSGIKPAEVETSVVD